MVDIPRSTTGTRGRQVGRTTEAEIGRPQPARDPGVRATVTPVTQGIEIDPRGKALRDFGEGVSNIGEAFADLKEKRDAAADKIYQATADMERNKRYTEIFQESLNEAADENYIPNLEKRFGEEWEKIKAELQRMNPSKKTMDNAEVAHLRATGAFLRQAAINRHNADIAEKTEQGMRLQDEAIQDVMDTGKWDTEELNRVIEQTTAHLPPEQRIKERKRVNQLAMEAMTQYYVGNDVPEQGLDILEENRDELDADTYLKTRAALEKADEVQNTQDEKDERNALGKEGYRLLANDELTKEWVMNNEKLLHRTDFKGLLRAVDPRNVSAKLTTAEWDELYKMARENPKQAIHELETRLVENNVGKKEYKSLYKRAESFLAGDGTSKYDSEIVQLAESFIPSDKDIPEWNVRKTEVGDEMRAWLLENPDATRKEKRNEAVSIGQDYALSIGAAGDSVRELPKPGSLVHVPTQDLTIEMLREEVANIAGTFELEGPDMLPDRNEDLLEEYAQQMALARRWMAIIRRKAR